ncbi:MAG TPA: oleate hydratase [Pseudomonadales bacterium]|nr:oleate hydratase [Pseudomonadales bacterium]
MNAPVGEAWLVGGGIASLAAAALLIRDGGMDGSRIHVLEQGSVFGGSLDGSGDAEAGYLIRGGRMFEPHFGCTYNLFASIPSLDDPARSVTEEIHAFTERFLPSSHCRIVRGGRRVEAPALQLSARDVHDLVLLCLLPERALRARAIEAHFRPAFFASDFWLMFSTMFAFQTWHSLAEMRRYMRRFMHLLPGLSRLEGIQRTPLNQYDSLVAPLLAWLQAQGVDLRSDCRVMDVRFDSTASPSRVIGIHVEEGGLPRAIDVPAEDLVFVTLGSMTDASSTGDWSSPPAVTPEASPAWDLWRRIASRSRAFGRPQVFASDPARSRWESFTVTLRDPAFFDHMEAFTGNAAGTGGLVTFADSSWQLSIVLPHQPHFRGQPDDAWVFWGYGLAPDARGDRVSGRMRDCRGEDLVREVFHHLGITEHFDAWTRSARCVPCMMPFITSQFMPRSAGDRPTVIPEGARNFAVLGQFCELPDDTVFTVEYSVRSAQTAVYGLLGLDRRPTPLYRGFERPAVVGRALRTLLAT